MPPSARRAPLRRARRTFVGLLVIAIIAAGSLNAGLGSGSSPMTGLRVAVSGVFLIAALALAARVSIAVERARRKVGQAT